MSKTLRKRITIKSSCSLSLYGGTFGPIRSPFYETIPNIARLIGDGIEVYEETPNGRVRLTMTNFDKFEGEEKRIAKEEADAKAKAIREQKERDSRIEAERQAKAKAQQEQRAREEQQRNAQRNQNNKQNQKNHQPQNNQHAQPQQPVVDAIVEE